MGGTCRTTCRSLASLFIILSLIHELSATALTPVRVAFLTDCKWYSDWQSIGMIYSFKKSGQPGKITRVMCCSEKDREKYPVQILKEVDTHIAPSYTIHPVTGDNYAPYNKPEAVIDWLQHVTPEEQYILVLDSDMILRRPFLVEVMKPKPGLAVGARYTYMIGVDNELALRHIPEIAPRNDTLAGPLGRRGDQVGGFFFIHRDDLKRMSTLWLKYTEDVRADPMAYKYSGDVYAVNPGDKPWISEMYGYAYGAAKADVWHVWDSNSMIYPEYEPHDIPKLMHYGLLFNVQGYKFDKHWHYGFDITKCPPWDFSDKTHRSAGLFQQPPNFSEFTTKDTVGLYYRDLLAIETVATLNAGFCDFHVRHCPPSEQLLTECKKASAYYQEVTAEVRRLEATLGCVDMHEKCATWAEQGECETNRGYMEDTCMKSCNICTTPMPMVDLAPVSDELERNLVEMEKKLASSQEATNQDAKNHGADPDTKNHASTDPDAKKKQGTDLDSKNQKAADPDAKAASSSPLAPQVIPHHEEKTGVETEQQLSPPVQSPPPPPPPSPVVQPSPPPPSPSAETQVKAPDDDVSNPTVLPTAPKSLKSRKELLTQCYRMPLTLNEVKDCVKEAQNGFEYHRKRKVLTVTAPEILPREDGDHDAVHRASTNANGKGDSIIGPKPVLGGKMPTWLIVVLWVLVVALFLFFVTRLFRLRRRPKSGMRSE